MCNRRAWRIYPYATDHVPSPNGTVLGDHDLWCKGICARSICLWQSDVTAMITEDEININRKEAS